MRIFKLILLILIFLSISYYVVLNNVVSYEDFTKTDFLFTFLGVFIGFALTLYTYLTSMFENMKKIIRTKYVNDVITRDSKLDLLPKLHNEIKDNIVFLIYVLVIVVLIAVLDKSIMKIEFYNCCLNIKMIDVKNSILLTIFSLSILALVDLVRTSFTISDFIIKN